MDSIRKATCTPTEITHLPLYYIDRYLCYYYALILGAKDDVKDTRDEMLGRDTWHIVMLQVC